MVNNRKYIRCSYSYDASIRDADEHWREISVENISVGGLNFFIKTAKFKKGDELFFMLQVESVNNDKYVTYESTAKGRIVRIVPCDDGRFEYGVEFIEKDMPSLMEIIKFIMG